MRPNCAAAAVWWAVEATVEIGANAADTEVTEAPPDTADRLEYEGASNSPCSDSDRSMVGNG